MKKECAIKLFLTAVATIGLCAPLAAEPLAPDAGPFAAQGAFTDRDNHIGQWHAEGMLLQSRFNGTLVLEMQGTTRNFTLRPGRGDVRRGTCTWRGENDRNHVQLRAACDDSAIGPGKITGFVDGHGFSGQFKGKMTLGHDALPVPAPAAGKIG